MTTVYPTGEARILGDPVVGTPPELVTDCSPAVAAVLLAYSPAAFRAETTEFSDALEAGGTPHNAIADPPPIEAPPPAADGATEGPTEGAGPDPTPPDAPSDDSTAGQPEGAV